MTSFITCCYTVFILFNCYAVSTTLSFILSPSIDNHRCSCLGYPSTRATNSRTIINDRPYKINNLLKLHSQTQSEVTPSSSINSSVVDSYNNNNGSKPYIELTHKSTNTTIVLIGCLHGSSSSSNDVETILNAEPTDVVVLELCPTRYKDLIKYNLSKREKKMTKSNNAGSEYLEMVSKTIQARGISTGIAAAILGGASSISSSLSGFETGLEFITAIDYVQQLKHNNGEDDHNKCDIILGDRFVDETMKGVGSIPKLSYSMWHEFMQQGWNWEKTYGIDANVISNAISGDADLKQKGYQVDMGKVLSRNEDVKNDLLRLVLPSFVFVQLGVLLLNGSLASLLQSTESLSSVYDLDMLLDVSFLMTDTDWKNLFVDFMVEIITSGLVLIVGYISLALPSVRVILTERDIQLTESIEAACKIATATEQICRDGNNNNNRDSNERRPKRVVAVLGLLHVNGIAKKLIET